MADYDGAVIIRTDIDTGPYDKGLREMEASAKSFSGNLSSIIARGFAAVGLGFSVKEIANFAGIMTDLESRAKVASKGLEETGVIMGRLRDIADAAYSPLEATANAFMNNATALNALGMSMKDQLDLTESMTNALIVAGAKGEQFELVMNAVNRSLATGTMKSQELQIVQKYGGTVAEAIAKQLGTTVNHLKEFAAQGKITASVISDALVGSLEEFKQKSADMPATISDAMVRLRNQVLATVGELNKATGFEHMIVQGVDTLRDGLKGLDADMDTLAAVSTTLFVSILGGKALSSIANLIKSKAMLTRATISEAQAERASAALKQQTQATEAAVANQRMRDAALRQKQAAQNLAIVQEEIQAEISRQRFIIQSSASEVRRLEIRAADTRAALVQLQATLKLTEAEARRHVLGQKLYALELQLATAKGRHTAATASLATANNALIASSSRAAVAMTGLKAAGSSVLAMFGGPWGLALTAAAAGVYYLATRQSEGEKAAEKYGEEMAKLREKYNIVRDGAEDAANAIEETTSRLARSLEEGSKSVEKQTSDITRMLDKLLAYQFEEGTRMRGELIGQGFLYGAEEAEQALRKILVAIKQGRKDVYPEVKAFDEAVTKHFGVNIPESAVKAVEALTKLALGLEATADRLAADTEKYNGALAAVGEIDWTPILNRQQTFSEQLIAQLEEMGVKVKGLKLLDITDSIASLESSQKKFTEITSAMVAKLDEELGRIRKMMDETIKQGGTIPPEVIAREAELVQRRLTLNIDMYNALNAQRAEFLAKERMALEKSLSNKKLSVQKELEIRKQAAAELAAAMAAEGKATEAVLQAIVNVAAESDNLGDAQKYVAEAAIAAAKAQLKAQSAAAALAAAAAAAIGDMDAFYEAIARVAAAAAALANLETITIDIPGGKGRGGGGGGRKGGGGGLDERKKSLQEIELILAKLSGDFEKIREIEANKELERFVDLVKKAGLSSAEAAEKIAQFKEKQGSAVNTENLQTLVSFYDELRNMIPLAGEKFQELNNILIEQKAQALLAAGAMEELVAEWVKLQQLASDPSWEAGIKRGAQAFINEWGNAGKMAEKTMETMIQGVQDLASGVIDAIFGDAEFRADQFLKSLAKKFLQLALNEAIAKLLELMGLGVKAGTAHTGGIVGVDVIRGGAPTKAVSPLAFAHAPKFHAGGIVGLSGTEVPAILQRGEGVFTRAQMSKLAPVDRQVELRQKIEVINPPGVPLTADVRTSRAPDGTNQTSIVLKSIEEGLTNRMRAGESRLSQAMEGRYGLNSAKGAYFRTGGT